MAKREAVDRQTLSTNITLTPDVTHNEQANNYLSVRPQDITHLTVSVTVPPEYLTTPSAFSPKYHQKDWNAFRQKALTTELVRKATEYEGVQTQWQSGCRYQIHIDDFSAGSLSFKGETVGVKRFNDYFAQRFNSHYHN